MKQSFWKKILGYPPDFSLEARIFNATCLASAVVLFLNIFLNSLLGIQQLVVLMVTVFAIAVLCYYYSRFKKKWNTCIVVYMITCNILLIVNYKYNSGINGPSLLIFILSYFLTISVVPKKQYWFWITLNLVIVITLLAIEYIYPGTIKNTYPDNTSRFIDVGYTYLIIVFFIFLVTTSVRRSYYTERKLVEQKATELEYANATMNKLFSILAHDLRSPLASIQNYLEVLSEFKLNEDEKSSIQKELLNSTQNTQEMLANLLLWSKSQMRGVVVNMVKLNLKKSLETTLHIHQTVAAEKGIQLTDQLKNSIFITADTDMLQLIIRNLINNALKFTNPGGQIIVSADIIGNNCRIMIKDNGLGIPYEQQNDIFSLKTESTSGTKNEKGVGLGLLLCKEFTELQNGKITFESIPGTGTTFYVSFKLCQAINENDINEGQLVKKNQV
ncbi:sensor histidine kinase [Mucilaginibacter sp. OK098]|uniref:sensor histidine kinase n=1 Tax=Mucilaginibacter sp. OK098 TaxID=1855297 RepID=UPI000915FB55|nr:HAMP domain-containing sensor histidine kinase [Mucilaginibacter sp. OK098]SHM97279.1 His Kinase A (phospho-acceptor) domain-containing protein [Mucilaginibacter sp. OK098]